MGAKALNSSGSIDTKHHRSHKNLNTIQRKESDFVNLNNIGSDVVEGERKQKRVNSDGEQEEVSRGLEKNDYEKQIVPVFAQAFEMLPSLTNEINSIATASGGEASIPASKGFSRAR